MRWMNSTGRIFSPSISWTTRTQTKAKRELQKLNKGPLLEKVMIIWEELEKSRVFINKVVEYCNSESESKTTELVSNLEESFIEQNTTKTSATKDKLDEQLKEINEKLTSWGNNIVTDMRVVLKEEIAGALPGVVKEAVKEMSNNTKLTKPWSDLFKKSQEELKYEANKVFHESLATVITESQQEIIENVQMKHDCDMFEK